MYKFLICLIAGFYVSAKAVAQQTPVALTAEQHRPQFHFSPHKNWMNDPNGMVYYKGAYHLFFQYYPEGTNWGPMHWGHATSRDMFHWDEQPIALYPDSLGWIFSGSVVVDNYNTTGFGKSGQVPLVAIFTHHNSAWEKAKRTDFQYQSIAYSLDEGKTWTKYEGNPVLPNPGIIDFRDPKVRWYEPQKKWIMTLATKDRITFYSSPDLKSWTKESEFGQDIGAHGGVWECPDLFPLKSTGKEVWVLLGSINPGGPNGGSATQYFVGDFNGKTFKPYSKATKWMDYGTDNYAGVTFANIPDRTILMGWMSNWQYAGVVPTTPWRSAMTIPRELGVKKVGEEWFLTSMPVKELAALNLESTVVKPPLIKNAYELKPAKAKATGLFRLDVTTATLADFSVVLANEKGNELVVGYDKVSNTYYIDRTHAGKTDFEKGFGKRHTAPRLVKTPALSLMLVVDVASVELFADNGLTVMTDIFFPEKELTKLVLKSTKGISVGQVKYTPLKAALK